VNCLPRNLKFLRKHRKLRQEEMQEQVGFSRSTWSNYENGNTDPSIDNLIKISNFFGISLDDLVTKDLAAGDIFSEGMVENAGISKPSSYALNETVSLANDDGDDVRYLLNEVAILRKDIDTMRKDIDTLRKGSKRNN
jgi:transcriptional regulator with XRE-family HTH domain